MVRTTVPFLASQSDRANGNIVLNKRHRENCRVPKAKRHGVRVGELVCRFGGRKIVNMNSFKVNHRSPGCPASIDRPLLESNWNSPNMRDVTK